MTNPTQTSRAGTLLLGLALTLALGVAIVPTFFVTEAQLATGEWFAGVDTYMRVLRVREWLSADGWPGAWYETFSARSNAPYGEVQHWTRPMDMALVALAAPFMPFVGLEKALYLAGFFISPVLMMLALWAFLWGTRRLLDARGQIILVVLFTFQPVTHYYFVAARPDHHSMILLCFACVVAFLARFATDPKAETRTVTWAGVVAGLGMWVSVESLTIVLFALLALGLVWLFSGRDLWLEALRRFTQACALTAALALMAERPPAEWLTSETFDRLSTAQVSLLALIALGVEAIRRSRVRFGDGGGVRLATSVLSATAAAAVMAGLFPDFFKGPFGAAMDPRLDALWLSKVNEFQPLLGTDKNTLVELIFMFGPMAWGMLWAFSAWRSPTRAPHIPALVTVLGVSMALFAPLTILQARWGGYMGVAVVIPWALLLTRLLDWRGGPLFGPAPGTPALRTPLFLLVAIGHIALSGMVTAVTSAGDESAEDKPQKCQWRKIAPYLNSAQFAGGEPQTLLNYIHTGPEIIYRTPHRVVGTPYHRNTQGLLDTFTVLGGTDLAEARAILRKRGVDFVVLCVDSVEEDMMLAFEGDTVMRRIIENRAPAWLVKSPLPDGLDAYFRLYRFVPNSP